MNDTSNPIIKDENQDFAFFSAQNEVNPPVPGNNPFSIQNNNDPFGDLDKGDQPPQNKQ